ncbi:cytochrome P450 [Streptomyces cellostaticus]|uniref:Cytochrome P450 n=1 Tax=Streptomyces cellostaticus TaxID=67285 RepID=A0A101N0R8_9ACTN|nr:cytochrome P450 [Streptomyces cellostaticus]KUM84452.1 cytochrome P450 [Streptomyces cellostaticus]GHI01801.1 Epi-isozizaene 5-monooxygenase/(E)-beta-farnesene synthase [Streptomyces cellostaticus]
MTIEPNRASAASVQLPAVPPQAVGGLPVLGHAWKLMRDPLGFLTELRDHGDLVRIKLGPKSVYVATAPELVGSLLKNPDCVVGGPLWDTLEVLLGKGVATSNGQLHRRQRRMIQPAFTPERIANYATVMEEEAQATAARWQPGTVIDISSELFNTAVRIVARSLLEVDSLGEKADLIGQALHTVFEGLYRRMILSAGALYRLPTPANRRFDRALAALHEVVDEIVTERRSSRQQRADLLAVLLAATDEHGNPLKDREIHDHIVSLVVAGAENVASTIAWTLHLLTEHPEQERRLVDEVNLLTSGRPVTFADLGQLPHTRNVITEAMRLRPAAWIFTRRTAAATTLGPFRIPPHTDIAYSPYAMQRDPRSFDQPLMFDPDRWTSGRAAAVPKLAMMPFGTGNRQCPGDHFALAELVIILATVTARWRLLPAPGTDTTTQIGITLHPKRLLLRTEPR